MINLLTYLFIKITLLTLRKYYKTHRNPKWIFPALGHNGGKDAQSAKDHVSDSGVQGALQRTLKRLGFKKHIHPHVFRHAYATHLIYGAQYLALYGDRMPQIHKKTIQYICDCRNGSFGTILYACNDCQNIQPVPCCCGNRHCPTCQHDKADQWLHKQIDKLLPTHYFLLTITLPKGLREVVRSNQKIAYAAMFSCAHKALKKLAKDKRFIGSTRIGYLAVLHTWGRMLQYHPHLHLVIPGGAVSEKGDEWLSSRQDLFVHTKPLALIFKAKFRDAMKKAQLFDKTDPDLWKQQWVADRQAVGKGQNSLRYLSRYVFRVAISNNRIKSIENGIITFLYNDDE